MTRRLEDYVDISRSDAREQFKVLQKRTPRPFGKRQVTFLPVETLLCLAASRVVNHRMFGGSTAHRAPEPVPSLANLFCRPPSSILAKMANLDGSRSHGAKYEQEVANRLASSSDELKGIYERLLIAARDVGIDANQLPDFLTQEEWR